MMFEAQTRHDMVRLSKSLFNRGYSVGSAGNISARVSDGILITPTNSCLGFLDPDQISKVDATGRLVSGEKPSKEIFLHQAFYDTRPGTGAVVHLHSTYATALSCLADTDEDDCIPALTPYVVMRVGRVKLLPYLRPGHSDLGRLIAELKGTRTAVLLANHGSVVAGRDLKSAVSAAEELEETAKLLLLLHKADVRYLTAQDVTELETAFPQDRSDAVPKKSDALSKNVRTIEPFLD